MIEDVRMNVEVDRGFISTRQFGHALDTVVFVETVVTSQHCVA